ncbi:trypsin-like peptidase domain-containing protein [Vibrio cyclitrophicus]|uniref:S1 family peptidase n=1 Tax=Vibrio cyclitrophicus TaxID=47951 RepID=UPI002068D51E|nr:serine protease [Vibrio cyclitrophicus]UPR24563.1 trypsin-like peptidase domain-containing protein [Vibrio cyclitrophicus]
MSQYVSPTEQLVHSTIRIECQTPNGQSSGSGYFYSFLRQESGRHVPCIVTNKHVIAGASRGKFYLSVKDEAGNVDLGNHFPVEFDNFENRWIGHPDENIDLAIFLLGPILYEAQAQNINVHYVMLDSGCTASDDLLGSLPTMEEIIMIGYPNGIWDEVHNLPIIRKGISATHPKLCYNGKPEFMIDAACFPGSSGSPVFLANIGSFVDSSGALCAGTRIALLGTLYAGPQHTATGEVRVVNVPTANMPISISSIPNNLGLVIHASKLKDFEPILQTILNFENDA